MKRDMDLVRQLLLKIEEHEHGLAPRDLALDGYADEQIGYHVYLMGQASLLNVTDVYALGQRLPRGDPYAHDVGGSRFS